MFIKSSGKCPLSNLPFHLLLKHLVPPCAAVFVAWWSATKNVPTFVAEKEDVHLQMENLFLRVKSVHFARLTFQRAIVCFKEHNCLFQKNAFKRVARLLATFQEITLLLKRALTDFVCMFSLTQKLCKKTRILQIVKGFCKFILLSWFFTNQRSKSGSIVKNMILMLLLLVMMMMFFFFWIMVFHLVGQ